MRGILIFILFNSLGGSVMENKLKWTKPLLTKLGQARLSSGAECIGGSGNLWACFAGGDVAEVACSGGYSPQTLCGTGSGNV